MLSSHSPVVKQGPLTRGNVPITGTVSLTRSGKLNEKVNGKPPLPVKRAPVPTKGSDVQMKLKRPASQSSTTSSVSSTTSRVSNSSTVTGIKKTPSVSTPPLRNTLSRETKAPIQSSTPKGVNSSAKSVKSYQFKKPPSRPNSARSTVSRTSSVTTISSTISSKRSASVSRSSSSLSKTSISSTKGIPAPKTHEILKEQEIPGKVTFALIARRNVDQLQNSSMIEIEEQMSILTHARLDREGILDLSGLECIKDSVTHVYLHRNALTELNMIPLPQLKFLVLSDNQIETIRGLGQCPNLKLLDLSRNRLISLESEEYPTSLVYVMLEGNPIADNTDYRLRAAYAFPNLEELDGAPVTILERRVAKRTFMPIEEWCQQDPDGDSDDNKSEGESQGSTSEENQVSQTLDMTPSIYQSGLAGILARSKERQKEQQENMVQNLMTKEFDSSMKLWSEQRREELKKRIQAMKRSAE